jgi:hypothetical protein
MKKQKGGLNLKKTLLYVVIIVVVIIAIKMLYLLYVGNELIKVSENEQKSQKTVEGFTVNDSKEQCKNCSVKVNMDSLL